MSYQYPVAGAVYKGNQQCQFAVWAPQKEHVEIIFKGEKEKHYPLMRDERGYWSVKLSDISPGDEYAFRLNQEKVLPDPASRSQPKGVHGPSVVVDPSFTWTDSGWTGLHLSEMIIYELHVGTFSALNNFKGVIDKLGHLKALGINAIELMPLSQFPGERNWGYDGVYPFAVQHTYGGAEGLKQLINESHRQGIAVILDVVYNHQGPEGNYFPDYAPFFTDKYKTGWGKAINFDDAYCDGVRHFYWQNALMWLDEFKVDGLRLDAVHAIWDFSARHFIQELVAKVRDLEKRSGRKKVLIAELDLNNPKYIDPPSRGGYGMDGQWIDEFHHALHALLTGEVNGYYEDFGKVRHLAKAIEHAYVYTGEYSAHRKKCFGVVPDNPYDQFVVFSQNHDQVGNRMLGDRITTQLSFEGLKLAAATVLLSPQVPMLFMGEEYGEKNPFQYFISHTDKELVEMVRKGRKEEFSYFHWKGEVPDPQAEETFRQCILSWSHEADPLSARLLDYYKFLIAFRKERIAMRGRERNTVKVYPVDDNKIVAFERRYQQDGLLIILNFNQQKVTYTLSTSRTLKKIFDSSAAEWTLSDHQGDTPGEVTLNEIIQGSSLILNPQSVTIFEC